jgi:hypothetical protein
MFKFRRRQATTAEPPSNADAFLTLVSMKGTLEAIGDQIKDATEALELLDSTLDAYLTTIAIKGDPAQNERIREKVDNYGKRRRR